MSPDGHMEAALQRPELLVQVIPGVGGRLPLGEDGLHLGQAVLHPILALLQIPVGDPPRHQAVDCQQGNQRGQNGHCIIEEYPSLHLSSLLRTLPI